MALDRMPSKRAPGFVLRRWPWLAVAGLAVVAGGALAIGNLVSQSCGTSGAAIGCGAASLKPTAGVSVVTGYGHLTGKTRTVNGTPLHQIQLDRVHVLAGADRPVTVNGWLATLPHAGPGTAAAQVPGLWAPDGHLLAYLSKNTGAVQESSTLRVRPIVDDDVIFSAADCGSAPGNLKTVAFDGPLTEVPGSRSYIVAKCYGGFHASPVAQVRRLLR
jgi:hypothetical protein